MSGTTPAGGPNTVTGETGFDGFREKIFLDRYAMKDPRRHFHIGDLVVVLTKEDPKYPQKDIGIVEAVEGDNITCRLRSGDTVTQKRWKVDRPIETHVKQAWERMAKAIADNEQDAAKWMSEYEWLLDDFRFVPAGRIWTGLGTDQDLTYFNCYVIPMAPRRKHTRLEADDIRSALAKVLDHKNGSSNGVTNGMADGEWTADRLSDRLIDQIDSTHGLGNDSRQAIMDTLANMVEIMSRGGGVGINLSTLRPRYGYVKGVNGKSSGAVSWGALYSFATGLVEQGGCFEGNQRIATTKGLVKAAELADRIEGGEFIQALTHEGPRPITARFRNGVKPVYSVTTSRGFRVTVTDEHKMGVFRDGVITTVPLSKLQVGDEILTLLGTGVESENIELEDVNYGRSTMSRTLNEDVHFPSHLDEGLAYLLGYMYGDCYVHIGKKVSWQAPKAVKMATADTHPEIRETLTTLTRELFGIDAAIEYREEGYTDVAIYSRLVVEWLKQNGILKEKSADVRVPEVIFRSPIAVMGAFVAGYFDADGFDSISLEMLQGVQQILSANGILSHISSTDRSASGWRTIHRLSVTGAEFKDRMYAFMALSHKAKGEPGYRNQHNNYPKKALNIPGKALGSVRERLEHDNPVALAERMDPILNVVPDTIASIEPAGKTQVFDFEVLDVHMLSGNGLYTSNSRRGALMLITNVWHPDVIEFICSKNNEANIQRFRDEYQDKFPDANFVAHGISNANISIGVTDDFMEAVKNDTDWNLVFPDYEANPDAYDKEWKGDLQDWKRKGYPIKIHSTIRARDLWDLIVESAWASAEPGVVFIERYNKMANSWYFNPVICTNPCGEQGIGAWSVCNLGHINLSRFYDQAAQDVAWDRLERSVALGVRFLDNVIDITPYFFEENLEVQQGERRVGLGTMGVAELMIKLGLRYGSEESLDFLDRLYRFIALTAYKTSIQLAKEKGPFPECVPEKMVESGFMKTMPGEVLNEVLEHGIRNVTLLTQAPTGTVGTMSGTSTGIEPFYSWTYFRNSRLGQLQEVKEQIVQDYFDDHPDLEPKLDSLPEYFVNAMDLAPEEHVKVQAAVQRWTDSSISKTCNTPADYTVDQTRELYELAYDLGCKGITVYRDGSRDEQILELKKEEDVEETETQPEDSWGKIKPIKRNTPDRQLPAVNAVLDTPAGKVGVTLTFQDGKPFDFWISSTMKHGTATAGYVEAIGRLVSTLIRSGIDPWEVVEQLEDISTGESIGFGPKRVMSVPDAIAKWLRRIFESGHVPVDSTMAATLEVDVPEEREKKVTADTCPVCGAATLIGQEGCYTCNTCGYSKC